MKLLKAQHYDQLLIFIDNHNLCKRVVNKIRAIIRNRRLRKHQKLIQDFIHSSHKLTNLRP